MDTIRILVLGDVMGSGGVRAVESALIPLVNREEIDFVIANGENASGELKITREAAIRLLRAGVDVITGGNHTKSIPEFVRYLPKEPRLLRPQNFSANFPGRGYGVYPCNKFRIGVLNLSGKVYMEEVENPFTTADAVLSVLSQETPLIIVDMHAEATSEKVAMGYHLDGRVTAVLGSHTHVLTADEKILPGGTAYLTDLGLTGPADSVIGVKKEIALARFITGRRPKLEEASGPQKLEGAIVVADAATGRALEIKTLRLAVS